MTELGAPGPEGDQSWHLKPVDVVAAITANADHCDFVDIPVPREVLEQMVWAARRAQQGRSGVRNMVAVDDKGLIEQSKAFLTGFDGTPGALVVHCTDLKQARALGGVEYAKSSTPLDAGAACAHLGLMAQALGLGVCRTSGWREVAVREWIDLPEHIRPDAVVAVGWKASCDEVAGESNEPGPVHSNRFGHTFGGQP
ncbi:nitroreductase family protein [Nocardioides alcanivorans]|uniref:nitroreductase family protein n=1 Tax=Nocardioides alcanivorans TaxID=2897352 RepID=UPI001F19197D|nr:nitroreductase family protein [Nocardioides alcanivorans]